MPRVDKGAQVTLVVLVYRSMAWLNWCMAGCDLTKNDTRYRWLVVANDAEDDVIADLQDAEFDWIDHRNDNPGEYYINRVYRAWNRGVTEARTGLVCMLNSDMVGSDYWLDELASMKVSNQKLVPTSLLVESGRIPSAMPEYVKDFGMQPHRFKRTLWDYHAHSIRKPGMVSAGKLYMPILVGRQEFGDIGGYPNGNPVGTTGDKDLIRRYKKAGYDHVTALGSVVYHVQQGEMDIGDEDDA